MGKAKNRKTLKLYRVTISKPKFDSIPEPERLLFIRFGHVIDEINTFLRLFYWSAKTENLKTEEENARVAQSFAVARVLTGKLYEAYRLIRKHYFDDKISKEYDSLLDDSTRNDLRLLKRYFSKANLINTVRNRYAFHYFHDELAESLNQIPPTDDLVFYLSQENRNSLFCSADVIVRNAMLEAILPGQPDEAQEKLREETVTVTGWLLRFLYWYMYTLMARYLGNSFEKMGAKEVRIPKPPKNTEIELPYFLSFMEGE